MNDELNSTPAQSEPAGIQQMADMMGLTREPVSPVEIAMRKSYDIYKDLKWKVKQAGKEADLHALITAAMERTRTDVLVSNVREAALKKYQVMLDELTPPETGTAQPE